MGFIRVGCGLTLKHSTRKVITYSYKKFITLAPGGGVRVCYLSYENLWKSSLDDLCHIYIYSRKIIIIIIKNYVMMWYPCPKNNYKKDVFEKENTLAYLSGDEEEEKRLKHWWQVEVWLNRLMDIMRSTIRFVKFVSSEYILVAPR